MSSSATCATLKDLPSKSTTAARKAQSAGPAATSTHSRSQARGPNLDVLTPPAPLRRSRRATAQVPDQVPAPPGDVNMMDNTVLVPTTPPLPPTHPSSPVDPGNFFSPLTHLGSQSPSVEIPRTATPTMDSPPTRRTVSSGNLSIDGAETSSWAPGAPEFIRDFRAQYPAPPRASSEALDAAPKIGLMAPNVPAFVAPVAEDTQPELTGPTPLDLDPHPEPILEETAPLADPVLVPPPPRTPPAWLHPLPAAGA
ncbi:hypothetical protein DENSPDRAFT_876750 [Dentipellis sp. KUC8613]|nr:hypothetical protein DENSPDRAFT_876750 [Dentipellis sp. KUC8613]